MVKTFELIHKALLILAFWSFILFTIHLYRNEGNWVFTFINYGTALIACTCIFLAVSFVFFLLYKNDHKKKISQFKPVEVDGYNCNIGNPFRYTQKPEKIKKCEALDLHSIYFKSAVLYKEAEAKEQAELKRNEDNEKISDLLADKLVLNGKFKEIQTLLATYQYAKKRIDELEAKKTAYEQEALTDQSKRKKISKNEEIELLDLKANTIVHNEDDIRKRIKDIKTKLSEIDQQITEMKNNPSSKGKKKDDEVVEQMLIKMTKEGDSGYTMYGSEDVDFSLYTEHNKKGLLHYREAFEALYTLLPPDQQEVVDKNVANLMEALPMFEYEGVVSSAPKVKKVAGFEIDLQSYQLSIFTALFPVYSWLELRETNCIADFDLHDKRILWNAKNMYDIYVKRDADLSAKRVSVYSIPLKDYRGGFRLPHEEMGCLVELWRYVEKAKLLEVKDTNTKKVTSNITNHDLIGLIRDLISQEDRINGGNRDKRIGFWYDKKIYLEWDKFMVEAKHLFVNYYHNEAHKVHDLDNMLFYALKEEDYLSMEIKDKFNPLDTGDLYDNGELFDVTWESIKGGDNDKENISKGTLVLKVRSAFRRIPESAKKGSNAPTKTFVSDFACVKGTKFAESREKNKADFVKGKELIEEQLKKTIDAVDSESDELNKMLKAEKEADSTKTSQMPITEKNTKNSENKTLIDSFFDHMLDKVESGELEDKAKEIIQSSPKKDDDNENPPTDSTNDLEDLNLLLKADMSSIKESDETKEESKYIQDFDNFSLTLDNKVGTEAVTPPAPKKRNKRRKKVEKNAFDTEPMDVLEDKIPKEKQGIVIEVREEKKSSPTYFIQYLNDHLEQMDSRTKNERTFLSRVYLDRLRYQIMSKQITVKETDKPYWEFTRKQILEWIPVEMQLHLLTQPKIENLYEVIPQPMQTKEEFKDQVDEIQKIIQNPIKRIRSINIMKISQSPEIEIYKNIEVMSFRLNDLSRFIAQLEDRCFNLQKNRDKSIEFNPTPTSAKHYGVYRILATNSAILGELNITLKNYCAYKHKMGFKHFNDEIGRELDLIHCVNLEATNKTVFVFFAPRRSESKYLQHIESAKLRKSEINNTQTDLFEDMVNSNMTDATIDVVITADTEDQEPLSTLAAVEPQIEEPDLEHCEIEEPDLEHCEIEEPDLEHCEIEEPDLNENKHDSNPPQKP